MTEKNIRIVWLRNDLRLDDNPALFHACADDATVIPVYILDDAAAGNWKMGAASRWWLHHALQSLTDDLKDRLGLPLILRRGSAVDILPDLIKETGATGVYWNRNYEPWSIKRDKAIKKDLENNDITVDTYNGRLLFEPWTIETGKGDPYKVFTPFWRKCMENMERISEPLSAPDTAHAPKAYPDSDDLTTWDLLPTKPNWAQTIADQWTPSELAAKQRLTLFLDEKAGRYKDQRDSPSIDATSKMSPYLHFGQISPRRIWHTTRHHMENLHGNDGDYKNMDFFLREIGWREFSYHLLYHFPHTPDEPLYDKFKKVNWLTSSADFDAWKRGQTGIPIVDAGMRQLWQTGWQHNRVRMIAASLLIKNLFHDWRDGEQWYWDTLVDADLANNTQGWQWVAGCGADAAPYFRIFNPVTQGERFDKNGDYIRAFVPELKNMPNKYIHKPWDAPDDVLNEAGVTLGDNYPKPIVDLKTSRKRALERFDVMKD